jgi:hypothetical protein
MLHIISDIVIVRVINDKLSGFNKSVVSEMIVLAALLMI